jgi:hypothetical protein
MAEETILLKVEIDQSDAQKQLVQTEKNLLNLKKQQAELTKEYKEGKVSQDEYVKSNLALQKSIAKETDQKRTLTKLVDTESNSRNALKLRVSELTKEYDKLNKSTDAGAKRSQELQKELKQLNAEINKGSKGAGLFKDQIGNYPEAFNKITAAAGPFGQSIQSGAASLAKFATPLTGFVGIVAGLGQAYISSAVGAKDLESATNQVSAAIRIATNDFGSFIDELSGGKGAEGGGILASLAFNINRVIFGVGNATKGLLVSQAKSALKELELVQIDAQGIRKTFENEAENARRLRDDEAKSFEERLAASKQVESNLQANFQVRQVTQQRIIDQLEIIADLTGRSPEIRAQIKSAQAEIRDAQEEINGKLTENISARKTLLKLIDEARIAEAADARAQRRAVSFLPDEKVAEPDVETPAMKREARETEFLIEQGQIRFDATQDLNKSLLKANKQFYDEDLANKKRNLLLKEEQDRLALQVTSDVLGAASTLFEQNTQEYKLLATAQTLIDTYVGAQRAFNALAGIVPAGPVLGAAAAAAAVIAGLGRVAAINNVQFAEGGFTGPGSKYQPAGIVHAGEYVAPQSVVNSPSAQPHIAALEGMRKGYADGGFVTEQNISPYQNALITANAIKNLPPAVIGVREFTKVANRVQARESVSKL